MRSRADTAGRRWRRDTIRDQLSSVAVVPTYGGSDESIGQGSNIHTGSGVELHISDAASRRGETRHRKRAMTIILEIYCLYSASQKFGDILHVDEMHTRRYVLSKVVSFRMWSSTVPRVRGDGDP